MELSKAIIRAVELAKKVNEAEAEKQADSDLDSKSESRKRGGQPNSASQEKAAERIGVSPATVTQAKRQVAVVEANPELADLPQSTALKADAALSGSSF